MAEPPTPLSHPAPRTPPLPREPLRPPLRPTSALQQRRDRSPEERPSSSTLATPFDTILRPSTSLRLSATSSGPPLLSVSAMSSSAPCLSVVGASLISPPFGAPRRDGTMGRRACQPAASKCQNLFGAPGAGFGWGDTKLPRGRRGIVYCNSGLAAADAVADFALAMIIATFRHLPLVGVGAAGATNPAAFQDCHERATAVSHTLRGQALGLIGLGNIGHAIAPRAAFGFGMAIHYHDVYRKEAALETKLGATLVDEPALADALEAGLLSSAALDVHAAEPAVHPRLAAMAGSKAFLTCHNAGGTVETHAGFEELSMRNIMAVLAGQAAVTPVNLEHLQG
ncbi:D-mandelate dehydrogenase [Verticillium alfalfae VaMs.102]|uniref:D-mandelate dehydrogenase n=1 Tax=Verticillium alfalfae (strain VaMs.102 / ATCC MYA-4576 / FGSC 10136) TaxID=526221 RepID=C9SNG8_VERA1|nr:D-mandelate dehydrogenase [Verticillium alfalfae VaMs.102]EEY20333.1 D-mandelate dehydrogenase [Verticillium alfalfae VaMs.102]